MNYDVAQETRIGGRRVNQDRAAFAYTTDSLLLVVADGMGGMVRGEVAADITVRTVTSRFEESACPRIADPRAFIADAVQASQKAIFSFAEQQHMVESPGTTLVACLVQDGRVQFAHAGDSRAYLIREGRVEMRTRDHSVVQFLIEHRLITAEDAETHPERGVLLNCLGGVLEPSVEFSERMMLLPGDVILLCSDGLWGALPEEAMTRRVSLEPVGEALQHLAREAEKRAGSTSDNITAVALLWHGDAPSERATYERAVTVMLDPGLSPAEARRL